MTKRKTASAGDRSKGGILARLPVLREVRRFHFDRQPEGSVLLAHTDHGKFVVSTSDRIIGRYCYVTRKAAEFQKLSQVCDLLSSDQPQPRDFLVDVGANIGTVCISAISSGLFRRGIAIEPEPGNFRLLRTNVALNGFEDRIEILNMAAADSDGHELVLELAEGNHGDHRVRTTDVPGLYAEEDRPVISIPSVTIDSLGLPLNRDSALIWMDVQGYEGAVISGAIAALNKLIPLCMEFSPYALHRAGCYEQLLEVLSQTAYTHMLDLSDPSRERNFDIAGVLEIESRLGREGRFTDLLIW